MAKCYVDPKSGDRCFPTYLDSGAESVDANGKTWTSAARNGEWIGTRRIDPADYTVQDHPKPPSRTWKTDIEWHHGDDGPCRSRWRTGLCEYHRWQDPSTQLICLAERLREGHWSGSVSISPDHPLFGKHCEESVTGCGAGDGDPESIDPNVMRLSIDGEPPYLTGLYNDEPHELWWIGFIYDDGRHQQLDDPEGFAATKARCAELAAQLAAWRQE
jgi:hypothetical protein